MSQVLICKFTARQQVECTLPQARRDCALLGKVLEIYMSTVDND